MTHPVIGWRLDPDGRADLLVRFPPRYPRLIADHVTFGRTDKPLPPMPPAQSAAVIGHAHDGAGVEALVVEIAGTSARWDGGTYHVTWSLADGREARESNDVIARLGWSPVSGRLEVGLTAAEWP